MLGSQQDIESHGNIFKVLQLEVQEEDEENEQMNQLKKALIVRKFQGMSHSDKVLEMDELVANMGDLSMEPPPEFVQKGNEASS